MRNFSWKLIMAIALPPLVWSCVNGSSSNTDRYYTPIQRHTSPSAPTPPMTQPFRETTTSYDKEESEDAYDDGYNEGYDTGYYDGQHGRTYGFNYDDSSTYTGHPEDCYIEGYEDGYNDGYSVGRSEYEDEHDDDEFNDDDDDE